jgi:glutamine synthetase
MTAAENIVNFAIFDQFRDLDQNGAVQAEYVWIGGSGMDLRCKTRTFRDGEHKQLSTLPVWNYDGSSTDQALGHDSEVLLIPVRIYKDPFRRGDNILVMCKTVRPDGTELETNHRGTAEKIFDAVKEHHPWFGIEQEYTMFNKAGRPLGWPTNPMQYPRPQGPYYCSIGANNNFGRPVVEAHYRACLYAGVKIAGINAEVMPGQWEFQVGPCEGIQIGDDLWMARYLLQRVGEFFGVTINFSPKPIDGDWNGAGCHTNYSTETMRNAGGYKAIIEAIEKLSKKHMEHIDVYGEDNDKRLTGRHETANIAEFTYGVANRGASIRIPRDTEKNQCGYFEDRRPASNIDPYVVASKIAQTTLL